ncbi:hypothetical protein SMALA_7974 [Streptomyces malaysiensis subsp. malaysiensis]|nr:hypothetical protein SMALA_7974 [Streptomyces malaysiensis]
MLIHTATGAAAMIETVFKTEDLPVADRVDAWREKLVPATRARGPGLPSRLPMSVDVPRPRDHRVRLDPPAASGACPRATRRSGPERCPGASRRRARGLRAPSGLHACVPLGLWHVAPRLPPPCPAPGDGDGSSNNRGLCVNTSAPAARRMTSVA